MFLAFFACFKCLLSFAYILLKGNMYSGLHPVHAITTFSQLKAMMQFIVLYFILRVWFFKSVFQNSTKDFPLWNLLDAYVCLHIIINHYKWYTLSCLSIYASAVFYLCVETCMVIVHEPCALAFIIAYKCNTHSEWICKTPQKLCGFGGCGGEDCYL